jgi:hypothetical protein
LTGENVEEIFTRLAKIILTKLESGLLDKNSMIHGISPGPNAFNPVEEQK